MNPEDLRPQHLSEIVGQTNALKVLNGLIEAHRTRSRPVPHLLFTGPPGTGKSTAALAFAHELLGDDFDGNFLEMNASDERKIEDVREKVATYVSRLPAGNAEFKFLFLDEADELTPNAQAALRRIMEEGSGTTRFILAGNHSTKIIPAIHSRCLVLQFPPLSDTEIREVIAQAAAKIGIVPAPSLVDSIVAHVDGAGRDAVMALIGGDDQTRKWQALDERIRTFLTPNNGAGPAARVEPFCQFLRQEGFSGATELETVLDTMVKVAFRENLVPDAKKAQFVETIGQHARWLASVAVPLLQVRACGYAVLRGLA